MVSHPETGSDSPIGSDRDRGRDNLSLLAITRHKFLPFYSIVRLCWTSSKGTEPTDQSPSEVIDFNHALAPM